MKKKLLLARRRASEGMTATSELYCLRRAISLPPTDSGDQAAKNELADDEARDNSVLPSKHAAAAKSGLCKTSSKEYAIPYLTSSQLMDCV